MSTTYRGYDISQNANGTYSIHSMGSYPVVKETFKTEDAAMDYIDGERRKALAARRS